LDFGSYFKKLSFEAYFAIFSSAIPSPRLGIHSKNVETYLINNEIYSNLTAECATFLKFFQRSPKSSTTISLDSSFEKRYPIKVIKFQ
jgi:hypothetical protein